MMSLSPYFEDKDVASQLRSFFDREEQWSIDFMVCLSQVEDLDEDFYIVKVKNREFKIHKIIGIVEEVK